MSDARPGHAQTPGSQPNWCTFYKPAPEVYETASRLLGVEPAELMLVGAHPADLSGARRAELKTAFLDRPLEYGAGSPARGDPEADLAVRDLSDLAERLTA